MCPPGSTHPPPPRLGDLRGPSFPRSPAAFSGSRRKVGFRLFPLSRRSADCQVLAAATAPQLRRDSGRGTRGLHGAPTDARAAPRSRPRPAAAPGPRRARHTGRRQDTQPCAWRQILLPTSPSAARPPAPPPIPHPAAPHREAKPAWVALVLGAESIVRRHLPARRLARPLSELFLSLFARWGRFICNNVPSEAAEGAAGASSAAQTRSGGETVFLCV